MIQVFDEKALNILPLPNGFIVAYKKAEDENDDKMVVAYTLVSFEKENSSSVTRSVYQLAKFGSLYKMIEKQLENSFYWKTIFLPNDKLFAFYPDGSAVIFDAEARVIWSGTVLYDNSGAADFVLQGNSLWASFPNSDCVAKFNIGTMREELRIGGKSSAFSRPEGLFLEGDKLYVCSEGNGKVWEVNTNNYAVLEHMDFGEPVHQYLKVGGFTLARLDSGVYKL